MTHRPNLGKVLCHQSPEGAIVVCPGYAEGKRKADKVGELLGWLVTREQNVQGRVNHGRSKSRVCIRSCGPIQVGLTKYWLAVAEAQTAIFLAKDGKVWRFPRVTLSSPAPALEHMEVDQQFCYADLVARLFAAKVTPEPEATLLGRAATHYHNSVRSMLKTRVAECTAAGFPRVALDFAHAVCETWEVADFVAPRLPSILHAVSVSLVLALPARSAGNLIELAALCEHRVGYVSHEAASLIYQEAAHLLGILNPAWARARHLTDWPSGLSLDRLWRWDFANRLHQASARQVSLADISGVTRLVGGAYSGAESEIEVDVSTMASGEGVVRVADSVELLDEDEDEEKAFGTSG